MAHGSLGSGTTEDTVRTAAARGDIAAGTQEDNIATLEATEDRYIRAIYLQAAADEGSSGVISAEVSKSATSKFPGGNVFVDETGSGVLAFTFSRADSANGWAQNSGSEQFVFDLSRIEGNLMWSEGEELSVHADNTMGTAEAVRVIIYYERVSDC